MEFYAGEETVPFTTAVRTPWHIWVVGVVSLLWNAIGAFDYTMTQTRNMAYLEGAGMGPDELAYLASFPAWANAAWAVGVWFCVLGSVLLLLRSRYAFPAFVASLVGIAVVTIFQFAFPAPASFNGTMALVFAIVLWAVTCGLALYSRVMAKKGVLR